MLSYWLIFTVLVCSLQSFSRCSTPFLSQGSSALCCDPIHKVLSMQQVVSEVGQIHTCNLDTIIKCGYNSDSI